MNRRRPLAARLVGTTLALAALLLTALWLLPDMMDLAPLKRRILTQMGNRLGGTVTAQKVELSFLPVPRAVLSRGAFLWPDTAQVTLESLTLYPAIIPLLKGKLRASKAQLVAPEVILLGLAAADGDQTEDSPTFTSVLQEMSRRMGRLPAKIPPMLLEVERGVVHAHHRGTRLASFWDLRGRLETIPEGFDLGFRFSAQRGAQKEVLREVHLRVSVRKRGDGATVRLRDLHIQDPPIRLSGQCSVESTPREVRLRLQGSDVEVGSLKRLASAAVGDVPLARSVFSVLRAGRVDPLTVESRGAELTDLTRLENVAIRGQLRGGEISVPGADLTVREARGKASISLGVLEGRDLHGRLESAQGRNGTLRLGLTGEDPAFRLDMEVEAEADEIHRYLKRMAPEGSWGRELHRVSRVWGRAEGRLSLRGTWPSVSVWLDVSRMRLFAQYAPFPYPVMIEEGRFSLEGDTIGLGKLRGHLGSSSFSDLTARVDLSGEPHLEVSSAQATLEVEELFPWLSSMDAMGFLREWLRSVQGRVKLSSAEFRGPLLRPASGRFQLTGAIQELAAEGPIFPDSVVVTGGRFELLSDRIVLLEARLRCLDASLTLSGELHRSPEASPEPDVTLDGKLGPLAQQWIQERAGLPVSLRVHPEIWVSGLRAGLKGEETWVAGKLQVPDGPLIAFDFQRDPDSLRLEDLTVRDGSSDASLSIQRASRILDLRFRGKLWGSTVDKVWAGVPFLEGEIQGDLAVRIPLDRPAAAEGLGQLHAKGVSLPWGVPAPFRLEQAFLAADETGFRLAESLVRWDGIPLRVQGKVAPSEETLELDMGISGGEVAWEEAKRFWYDVLQNATLPLTGKASLRLDTLRWGPWVLAPVEAELLLDPQAAEVKWKTAALCGISIPGTLWPDPREFSLTVRPASSEQPLGDALTCLGWPDLRATGTYSLQGEMAARGKPGDLLGSLEGKVEVTVRKGSVEGLDPLARVLELPPVRETLGGNGPKTAPKSLFFDELRATAHLRNSRLVLEDFVALGAPWKIVGEGMVDPVTRQMDLQFLVAAPTAPDPIPGRTLAPRREPDPSLAAVPVRFWGDWDEPQARILSPSAVLPTLLGAMKRVAGAPLRIGGPPKPLEKKAPDRKPSAKKGGIR